MFAVGVVTPLSQLDPDGLEGTVEREAVGGLPPWSVVAGQTLPELASQIERAPFRYVSGWSAAGELVVPTVWVDREPVPVPVPGAPLEPDPWRLEHRRGHRTAIERLIKDLAPRLSHRCLVGLCGSGKRINRKAGRLQARPEVGQVAELGLDVVTAVQRPETCDQFALESIEVTVEVGDGDQREPPVEVAPLDTGQCRPRFRSEDRRPAW